MKIIYWRWKGKKNCSVNKSYIQKDLGNMLELADSELYTNYPTIVLKREIKIEQKDDK